MSEIKPIPLKRCPFCGGPARIRTIVRKFTGNQYVVTCQQTKCFGRNYRRWDTQELAARNWNRRENNGN